MANLGYVLKAELLGFSVRLEVGLRRKKGVKIDRASGRIKLPFPVTRKTVGETGNGRKLGGSVWIY